MLNFKFEGNEAEIYQGGTTIVVPQGERKPPTLTKWGEICILNVDLDQKSVFIKKYFNLFWLEIIYDILMPTY